MKRRKICLALLAALAVSSGSFRLDAQSEISSVAKRPAGVLTFTLGPWGVQPKAIKVQPGLYLILVRNGVSLSALSVELDHPTLGAELRSSIKANKSGMQELVQLELGKHTLRIAGKADWSTSIEVAPAPGAGEAGR